MSAVGQFGVVVHREFERPGYNMPPASTVRDMVRVAKLYLADDLTFMHLYYSVAIAEADVRVCNCSPHLRALCQEWMEVVDKVRNEWSDAPPQISEETFRSWLAQQL